MAEANYLVCAAAQKSVKLNKGSVLLFIAQRVSASRRQVLIFALQLFARFNVIGVEWNALHRAHLNTLGRIKMAHAFRTFHRVDHIVIRAQINRIVRAFGFAYITVDALIRDH
jgi:hypothetical protein